MSNGERGILAGWWCPSCRRGGACRSGSSRSSVIKAHVKAAGCDRDKIKRFRTNERKGEAIRGKRRPASVWDRGA